MLPKARLGEELIVQDLGDELVVYDCKRDLAHFLNSTAAFVFQHCDGQTTPAQLATLLQQKFNVPQADGLMWLTLDRLEKADLLAGKVTRPADNGQKLYTRRQVLKMAGVTLALLPVVATIVAPTPAQASTPACPGGYEVVFSGGTWHCELISPTPDP